MCRYNHILAILRVICYRHKSGRDARQARGVDQAETNTSSVPLFQANWNNIEALRDDRWATGVNRKALQPRLRAICYRQKSDRDARQV